MKSSFSILIILFFAAIHMSGQSASMIGVSFGTSSYFINKVEPYDAASTNTLSDDLSFFFEHFRQADYQKYRSYYYNNSCLISEEDFKKWHNHITSVEVMPVARYIAYTNTDTLSIISYTIGTAANKEYFPLALQRINHKWYLLDLRKSEEMMGLKMFLAFANPDFIESFLKQPEEMKSKYMATIYNAKGNINGDLLMNYFDDRYDPAASRYALSKEAFHPTAVFSQDNIQKIMGQVSHLAGEYRISVTQKKLLDNMCSEGNYSMALKKIAEWSGTSDVIEITDKFQSGLQAAGNKN